jgi:uncharacterized Zn finger protein
MTESTTAKGARYLAERRVIIDHKVGDTIRARVRGTEEYGVSHGDGRWFCSCPSFRPCSHIVAVELVAAP